MLTVLSLLLLAVGTWPRDAGAGMTMTRTAPATQAASMAGPRDDFRTAPATVSAARPDPIGSGAPMPARAKVIAAAMGVDCAGCDAPAHGGATPAADTGFCVAGCGGMFASVLHGPQGLPQPSAMARRLGGRPVDGPGTGQGPGPDPRPPRTAI